jgi:glycosyltransferase involved in cell wall biosynthesis
MRIAADASHLRWRPTGVRRYTAGLLHALAGRLGPGDELVVYYNHLGGPPLFDGQTRERGLRAPGATLYTQAAIPAAMLLDRPDVYLGSAAILPIATAVPRVVVFHDCLPFRDPSAKPGADGRYLRRWMRRSAAAASRVLALSDYAADEVSEFLGVERASIGVAGCGIDDVFRAAPPGPAGDATARRGDAYILQVGAGDRHKGAPTLAEAVWMLRQRGHEVRLLRTGPPAEVRPAPWVEDLGVVDDAHLARLYRGAAALCVPSAHEGLGLPALEAMAAGTPVVLSRVPGLVEAGGEVALYAAPGDAAGFAAALERLLVDPGESLRRGRAGLDRSAAFTWTAVAEQVHDALLEAAQTQPRGR